MANGTAIAEIKNRYPVLTIDQRRESILSAAAELMAAEQISGQSDIRQVIGREALRLIEIVREQRRPRVLPPYHRNRKITVGRGPYGSMSDAFNTSQLLLANVPDETGTYEVDGYKLHMPARSRWHGSGAYLIAELYRTPEHVPIDEGSKLVGHFNITIPQSDMPGSQTEVYYTAYKEGRAIVGRAEVNQDIPAADPVQYQSELVAPERVYDYSLGLLRRIGLEFNPVQN